MVYFKILIIKVEFEYQGLIAATFAPMKENTDINVDVVPDYAAFLARNDIKGTVFENHRKSLIQQNAKNGPFWQFFENLKLAVKQCYQTGHF